MDRPTRSDQNSPILEPGPNCSPSGMVQWGPHHCWWPEGDCIDWLWTQVSNDSSRFWKQMSLKIHPLDRLLELEGTGGPAILYLGYVEVNLQIPGIRGYNENILCKILPFIPIKFQIYFIPIWPGCTEITPMNQTWSLIVLLLGIPGICSPDIVYCSLFTMFFSYGILPCNIIICFI